METSSPPQADFWEDDRPLSGQPMGIAQARPKAILWDTPQIAAYLDQFFPREERGPQARK